MSGLPAGWATAAIRELCTLENGRAFKPSDWTERGLPIVRIQNLNNAGASFNRFAGEIAERYRLRGGELLFAWSGTPGTSFGAHVWRGGDAVLNQHIFRVDFNDSVVEKRFFRHAINQKLEELIDVAHGGVGLRHVTKGVFEGTEVLVPPLPEQKRIADKLDALLARVDACRERLDRVPGILKRFRQSVLAAATSGELTRDWREERGIELQWNQLTVGDVIERIEAGINVQCEERPPEADEQGLVKISAVTWGRYDDDESKTLPTTREVPAPCVRGVVRVPGPPNLGPGTVLSSLGAEQGMTGEFIQ
ncbi:MAG: restriction endonuclease subunit S [Polyangiaceae bacterium]|nr:restriction endonuclease subunit S [Polyangiaceae bacterium]